MNARLLILLVGAAGLAVFVAFRTSAPPRQTDTGESQGSLLKQIDLLVIQQPPPPGEEPEVPPEFDIQVEVDASGGKNRLVFYISEAHGYYVQAPYIQIWWKEPGQEIEPENSLYVIDMMVNNYIKAGETFKDCIEVTGPELFDVGGDIGSSENWAATVYRHSCARVKNPDEFPSVDKTGRYCG